MSPSGSVERSNFRRASTDYVLHTLPRVNRAVPRRLCRSALVENKGPPSLLSIWAVVRRMQIIGVHESTKFGQPAAVCYALKNAPVPAETVALVSSARPRQSDWKMSGARAIESERESVWEQTMEGFRGRTQLIKAGAFIHPSATPTTNVDEPEGETFGLKTEFTRSAPGSPGISFSPASDLGTPQASPSSAFISASDTSTTTNQGELTTIQYCERLGLRRLSPESNCLAQSNCDSSCELALWRIAMSHGQAERHANPNLNQLGQATSKRLLPRGFWPESPAPLL